MNRLAAILLFLSLLPARAFELAITQSNVNLTLVGDSYFTDPSGTSPEVAPYTPDYVALYFATRYPTNFIRYLNASRSGGTDINTLTNLLHPYVLPFMGYRSNSYQQIVIIKATENGYVSSNFTYLSFSNFFLAPAIMSAGDSNLVSVTGWAATHPYQFIAMSDFPGEANDGRITTRGAESAAAMNAGTNLGLTAVEVYKQVFGSWTNDYITTGGTNVMWASGGKADHPGAGGHLNGTLAVIKGLTTNTIISDSMVDWNTAAVVSTNNCTVSSISKSANSITFTRHDNFIRFAWDVPNATTGITNDCRNAFNLNPADGTNFLFGMGVTNLPAGNYSVMVGGVLIGNISSAALAGDWNMFTNYLHPEWLQAVEALGLVRDLEYVNRITLIQGSAGDNSGFVSWGSVANTFWNSGHDHGDLLIAAMTLKNDQINTNYVAIHNQVQPTNLVYTITLITPRYAPAHR
jgi:hypothetical protein